MNSPHRGVFASDGCMSLPVFFGASVAEAGANVDPEAAGGSVFTGARSSSAGGGMAIFDLDLRSA